RPFSRNPLSPSRSRNPETLDAIPIPSRCEPCLDTVHRHPEPRIAVSHASPSYGRSSKVVSVGGGTTHPSASTPSKIVLTSDYAVVSAEPISNPHSYQPYDEIFTAGIDGSGVWPLTHNSFEYGTLAWSPIYMEPTDVAEASRPCEFEDCHWLDQGAASRFTFGDHPRCAIRQQMENDIDEVGKIARIAKTKVEELDKDICALYINVISAFTYVICLSAGCSALKKKLKEKMSEFQVIHLY
ncbi:hypothetical protein Taro_025791, partial [Colocasia esculenta]|nr:hypothetical protein [Colocasia esculenta]